MSVGIVGTVGVPSSYGGFETLVEHLIKKDHVKFTVYCSGKHFKKKLKSYKGAKLVYIPLKANGVSSIFYDIFSMLHACFCGNKNLLILGVSGAIFIPVIRLIFPKIRVITNIDGIEWKRDKWNFFIKGFIRFSEFLAIKFSNIVIADNKAIADYVKNSFGKQCETIAYGGDHVLVKSNNKNHNKPNLGSYVLGLCRIEPENNVHLILETFKNINKKLVFIGNWDSSKYGLNLKETFSSYENISLLDPIYDLETLFMHRSNCEFYVHGHSAGGTNPALVEMMHFGMPIVAYDCIFNRETLHHEGMYFKNENDLKKIFSSDNSHNPDKILQIARTKYNWKIIREQYFTLFKV